MIALLALFTTPLMGNPDIGVTFARDLISVNHLCNTLTTQGVDAYGFGSRGFSVFIRASELPSAERILEQDRKLFPFHHGRMTEREVFEPVHGESWRPLNVGQESLTTLNRDPLLRVLVVHSLEWAARGIETPYVMEVFLSNADFRESDGTIRKAYFGRVILGDRTDARHFGYVELFVKEGSDEREVNFGVWGENTLELLAAATKD